jgi:hypothetical protein
VAPFSNRVLEAKVARLGPMPETFSTAPSER